MPYPTIAVETQDGPRNRLTCFFRPILAIPHIILVGPAFWAIERGPWSFDGGGVGILGIAAYVMAVYSWFTLLLANRHLPGIRAFAFFYLRWRARSLAYAALFVDPYPPFGDAPYPATVEEPAEPPAPRDKVTIALRPILALPHLIVLVVLLFAWLLTTIVAWLAILIAGRYPRGLAAFGVGVMRWQLRVETYLLLLVDEYPTFAFG